jgi:AcrR family transcriptional regulator
MERSREAVLEHATVVLTAEPAASLADVARALGIGRTTLHRMFPTRAELLRAMAERAIDLLEETYAGAGLGDPGVDAMGALQAAVTALVPLGPTALFLLQARELDDDADLEARLVTANRSLLATVGRAIGAGTITGHDWWAAEALKSLIYAAWEQVAAGRLAPADAPGLVLDTWLGGVGSTA